MFTVYSYSETSPVWLDPANGHRTTTTVLACALWSAFINFNSLQKSNVFSKLSTTNRPKFLTSVNYTLGY